VCECESVSVSLCVSVSECMCVLCEKHGLTCTEQVLL